MSNFYTNPQPTTDPPNPPGGSINWSTRNKCEKLDNAELENLIREASRVLNERKDARAQKLIEKVCVALNELKEMGNIEMRFDCSYDAFVHDILDEVDHFRPEMFVIRRK